MTSPLTTFDMENRNMHDVCMNDHPYRSYKPHGR